MIKSKASNKHRYKLWAIDYFIKWVEAGSRVNLAKMQVALLIITIPFVDMVYLNPL